jgi:hypothetical protein
MANLAIYGHLEMREENQEVILGVLDGQRDEYARGGHLRQRKEVSDA